MSKTKILLGLSALVLALAVGIFVSFISPGLLKNAATTETPEQVVGKYMEYANRGQLDKVKTLLTKAPKSYRDYEAQLTTSEREGPVLVPPRLPSEAAPRSAETKTAEDWPRLFSDENWKIMEKRQVVVKGNDARVRVEMGPNGWVGYEFDFSLHQDIRGWKIFLVDYAKREKPFPRP